MRCLTDKLEKKIKDKKAKIGIVITTDHTSIDYSSLGKYAKLIVDTRNIMATVKNPKARVIRA